MDVMSVQQALIAELYATHDPEAMCEELRSWINRLSRGAVNPSDLVNHILATASDLRSS